LGVRLAAGSDAPVVPPRPLVGIQSAVSRLSQGGSRLNCDEALDAGEALRLHTDSAAWVAFQEAERGSIAPGKIADLVLLSNDPTTVPGDEIADLEVDMTIARGHVVWPPRPPESS
jgi:predicted amidohydrolase YtcJ